MSNYSHKELQAIKVEAQRLFKSNPKWKSIGVSMKEIAGQDFPEPVITLYVESKKKIEELGSDELFPDSVKVGRRRVKTDVCVVDSHNVIALASCHTLPANCSSDNTWLMPVSANRSTIRPLQGGTSCSIFPPSGYDGASVDTGTLGGICIDLEDNTIVGVSNNHVIGGYNVLGTHLSAYTNDNNLTYWSFLSANDTTSAPSEVEYPVYQRSSLDQCTTTKSTLDNLKVGTTKRAYPLNDIDNKLDVAIFALDTTKANLTSTSDNWKQLLMNYNTPMAFATTAEIDSLLTTQSGAPVFRSGRTEGPVGWPGTSYGSSTCTLTCYDVSSNLNVNYGGNLGSISFIDQLAVYGDADPSTGGDSGSFVCALYNSTNPSTSAWKIIGLLFAGNDGLERMYANRIDNVASMFRLSAYGGQTLPAKYTTKDVRVISSRQSAVTAMIGGKMYWQAGSTNMPVTTTFD